MKRAQMTTPASWREWDVRRMSPAGALRYALLLSALGSVRSLLMVPVTRRKRSRKRVAVNLLSPLGIVGIVWLIRRADHLRQAPITEVGTELRGGVAERTVRRAAFAVDWTYTHEMRGVLLGALVGSLIGLMLGVQKQLAVQKRRQSPSAEQADTGQAETTEPAQPTAIQDDPPHWWEVRGMSRKGAVAYAVLLTTLGMAQWILNAPLTNHGLRWRRLLAALACWAPFSAALVWNARRRDRQQQNKDVTPKHDEAEM